jgi:hypothetical protein
MHTTNSGQIVNLLHCQSLTNLIKKWYKIIPTVAVYHMAGQAKLGAMLWCCFHKQFISWLWTAICLWPIAPPHLVKCALVPLHSAFSLSRFFEWLRVLLATLLLENLFLTAYRSAMFRLWLLRFLHSEGLRCFAKKFYPDSISILCLWLVTWITLGLAEDTSCTH